MAFVESTNLDGVTRWNIRRPDRLNALGLNVAQELATLRRELVTSLATTPAMTRAVVITATPIANGQRRTWIAGGDLKELAEIATRDEARAYAALLTDFIEGLDLLPVPVLLAVDGVAIGGGAELALAGDLRIATDSSLLEFRQLEAGLATGYGSARRLVELVGLARAQTWLFSAAKVSAPTLLELGVFSTVVRDAEGLARECDRITAAWKRIGPASLAAQKAMFKTATRVHPGAALAAENDLFRALWRNPEHARFLAKFQAKDAGETSA